MDPPSQNQAGPAQDPAAGAALGSKKQKSRNGCLYLSERETNMRSGSLRKRNKQILQTDDPRSILDRNGFGHKHKQVETLYGFSTFGFGCWTWTTSKTVGKQYFVNKNDNLKFLPTHHPGSPPSQVAF